MVLGKNSRGRMAPDRRRMRRFFREERPTISSNQKAERPTRKEMRKLVRREIIKARRNKTKKEGVRLSLKY